MRHDDLVDTLADAGLLSADDARRAQALAERTGARLPLTLVRLGLVGEAELAAAAARCASAELVSREGLAAAMPLGALSERFLARRSVLPIGQDGDTLTIAMADPCDEEAVAALAFATGATSVTRTVATFTDIQEALARIAPEAASPEFASSESALSDPDDLERLAESDSDAPVIRLVQRLLTDAVNRRASDVHLEPMARRLVVRFRIDGRLVEVEQHPIALAGPIASRVKVLAALDIAESRLPQDGRLRLTVRGREVDVRVATSPTAHGESIVLRILGRSEVPLELDRLGLPAAALARLEAALARPHGIILLTGPTGSGKTTTLYAAINRLRRPDVKILTVEDPVEVLLDGINQVQVRPEIELSYAATLRAFLRQDPDILMIGEIRDLETAEIAMRAALTGHLVLSTLHTNSATGAFTRLADIGIEPYLTASTVIATIAQRLIRTLCASCARVRSPTQVEHDLFAAHDIAPPPSVAEAAGCPACAGTGYRGRTPLVEVFEVDEPARDAIRAGAGESLRQPGSADTLLAHGLLLAATGRTSLAEVRRAVQLA